MRLGGKPETGRPHEAADPCLPPRSPRARPDGRIGIANGLARPTTRPAPAPSGFRGLPRASEGFGHLRSAPAELWLEVHVVEQRLAASRKGGRRAGERDGGARDRAGRAGGRGGAPRVSPCDAHEVSVATTAFTVAAGRGWAAASDVPVATTGSFVARSGFAVVTTRCRGRQAERQKRAPAPRRLDPGGSGL